MASSDTIFALASAPGRAGVAVIRVSGTEAVGICESLVGRIEKPRYAYLRNVTHKDQILDQALVLYFEEQHSFTGESVVELQCHGSLAVTKSVLNALGSFKNARLAEPGEFTKRALLNGKMDLTHVEGLADLIEAETAEQQKQALRIMQGELSTKISHWRGILLEINALLEADIDFSDEELPGDFLDGVPALLGTLIDEFNNEILGSGASEVVRQGFEVAIIGPPNVGKSTLLNTIAGRQVAITSEVAGTTRDVIEVKLDLDGFAVTMLDTAGIRQASDDVENLGVQLAISRAKNADLKLVIVNDVSDIEDLGVEIDEIDIVAKSKCDLGTSEELISFSSKTNVGIDYLLKTVSSSLEKKVANRSLLIRERQVAELKTSLGALEQARKLITDVDYDIELVAELVREAIAALEHLIGRVDVEAVLGEIFSSFCIGK